LLINFEISMEVIAMSNKGEKTTYYYKLFRVKRSDGRVTTVSVDPVLVTQACRAMDGGLKAVAKCVREAAFEYAEGGEIKSCSGYVQNQLRNIVQGKRATTGAAMTAPAVAMAG
jgi:hypothetical protein